MMKIENRAPAQGHGHQDALLALYNHILFCKEQALAEGGDAAVYWLDMARITLEEKLDFSSDQARFAGEEGA